MSNAAAKSNQPLVADIMDRVKAVAGIQLGAKQESMVRNRLEKRFRELNLASLEEYAGYYDKHREAEIEALVSLLTTHHTYFFREFQHFELLANQVLPRLIDLKRNSADKTIRIWSAACSRGQEVYSLAMLCHEVLARLAPGFTYEIFGTDIDPESVKIASNGVYKWNELKEAPLAYLGDHWAKGAKELADWAKVRGSLKSHCQFGVMNLLSVTPPKSGIAYDVIFCRNVFIYFNAQQIHKITQDLCKSLHPAGSFFVGLSETIENEKIGLSRLGPSAYSLRPMLSAAPAPAKIAVNGKSIAPAATPQSETPKVFRVLCVDDSASVITLLKKILTPAQGFEVTAVAKNGKEAAEILAKQSFDVMTLDIHMPEVDGPTFLASHYDVTKHPPVIIVSSVSREDSSLAQKTLRLGASDYVEKPSFEKLLDMGEQLRSKLKAAWNARKLQRPAKISEADKQFAQKLVVPNAEKKLFVALGGLADRKRIEALGRECEEQDPPLMLLLESDENLVASWLQDLSLPNVQAWNSNNTAPFKKGHVYVAAFAGNFEKLQKMTWAKNDVAAFVFGRPAITAARKLSEWKGLYILAEDMGDASLDYVKAMSRDVVPATSFRYMGLRHLSGA